MNHYESSSNSYCIMYTYSIEYTLYIIQCTLYISGIQTNAILQRLKAITFCIWTPYYGT